MCRAPLALALGAVIVLLTWMWISAQVVLLGAEINKILTPARDQAKIETPRENAPRPVVVAAQPVRAPGAWFGLVVGYLIGRRKAR